MGMWQQSGEEAYGSVISPSGNSEKHVRDEACESVASSSSVKDCRATRVIRFKYCHTALGFGRPHFHMDSRVYSNAKALLLTCCETNPMPPRASALWATRNSTVNPST